MRVETMILLACLLVCAVPFGYADVPKDPMQRSQYSELKGDIARAKQEYPLAIAYYRSALTINRHSAVLYDKLGVAELKMNNYKAAQGYFKQSLKYDPHYINALNNLGALACLNKKYPDAVIYLKQALAQDESSAPTHINLAEAWIGMGEIDRAMTEYARALELDGDVLSADKSGLVAQVSTPEQQARVNFLIARAYARRGNAEGALEFLRRARDGGYPHMKEVYSDPEFAALQHDPRLVLLVKR